MENRIGIYVVDLQSGIFQPVKVAENARELLLSGEMHWDTFVQKMREKGFYGQNAEEFLEKFSLRTLQKTWKEGERRIEVTSERKFAEGYRYVSAAAHFYGDAGQSGYAVIAFQDIDDRIREEIKRSQNDRRMAAIIESRFQIMNTVHLETGAGERIYLEKGTRGRKEKLGNYQYYIKKAVERSVLEEDREAFLNAFDLKRLRKRAAEVENFHEELYCYRMKSPVFRWIEAHVFYLRQEEGVVVNILSRDITEKKQKEERDRQTLKEAYEAARQANAAKSEFLSRMSHDIRTPLNAIMGMATVAQNHLDDREWMEDCLEKIQISGNHLLALVNDVLDMSKIESGKMELMEAEFTFAELVDHLVAIVRPGMEERHHRLVVKTDKLSSDTVVGDMLRLQQVAVNLLSNAMKYTPDGGRIKLELKEKRSDVEGYGRYKMVIKDNGIGMDEEFQKKVFEPFARAEDSRISKIEGTGLGMTIVHNIVSMMNGTIEVKSSPEKGTKFTVTFYLKKKVQKEKKKKCETPKETRQIPDFKGCRILVVEDNELNREIAKELLSMSQAQIECAADGQEAVDLFVEHEEGYYDLIFMDIQMPVMNGHDAARTIRKSGKGDAASIPIVAMTANAFSEDIQASKRAGMNQHISKPLRVEELMRCLQRWIRKEK